MKITHGCDDGGGGDHLVHGGDDGRERDDLVTPLTLACKCEVCC